MRRILAVMILAACACGGPAMAAPIELWASFDLGEVGTFANISIPLSQGSFRVGGIGGALASDAQIAHVLSTLTDARIGGVGNAVFHEGGVGTSFGFRLTNPALGSGVTEQFLPFSDYPWGFSYFGPQAIGLSWTFDIGDPGGGIGMGSLEPTPGTLIGFVLSSLFTGDHSAAFGEDFTFRWEASPGLIFPPHYEQHAGRVILTGDDGVDAVPEPAAVAGFGAGLAMLALGRRRRARG